MPPPSYPPATIADLFLARADDDNPGVRTEDRTWTWREVVAESAQRAALLAELRTDRPFHIGVLLENVAEYVFLLGGAALAGGVVVGINPTRRGAELARDIRHTDCQVIFTDRSQLPLIDGLDVGPVVLIDEDYGALLDVHQGAPVPPRLPSEDDLYLLLFTSGSTGAPKAVRMTQGRAARTVASSARAFGPDDVLYCAMPLFHGNALLANLFPALTAGASVVLRRRFSATGFLPDIQRYGCTFFNYVGRALSYIVATPESLTERDNQLKWALGSEASPRDIAEFTRRFGCPIFEGYGSSENAVILLPAATMPANAMGRPPRGLDVAILDPDTERECAVAQFAPGGALVNPGDAIGEIVGRNSVAKFEGYYNNPEADAQRARHGWYWSGDLGYRDAEGWIYFAGRSADWLRVDGENFSSAPIERILARHPGVSGVAVYAAPDSVTGDQVMAAVEMKSGSDFDPDQFAAFLADQPDLGTKWSPRYVRIVASIPVTATRKVDKQPLRAARWDTEDPVWWRGSSGGAYRLMTADDRTALAAEFSANGRESALT